MDDLKTMSVAMFSDEFLPKYERNVLACAMIVAVGSDPDKGISTDTITVVSPSIDDKDFVYLVYLLRYLADEYEARRNKEEITSES